MNSLFGNVMVTEKPVISNNPKKDPRACGVPEGHPPLNHFLGIPFFEQAGSKMNGMVGIANKPGGYTEADIEFLEPFVVTCSNLILAYKAVQENKYLINTLEEKVAERTYELELANASLEEANRHIVQASAAQLEHFACMSHEIRTPLNCVIGLSSLLQETPLTPMQKDSLKMVVTSGELLLTVVNDVLDFSKLASGNVEIDIQRTNLQETLDAVVRSIQLKARERDLTVRTYYGSSVPEFFHTDSRRLQQVLFNLFGNAIKFSEEGRAVELSVFLSEPDTSDCNQCPPATEETKVEEKKATPPHPVPENGDTARCPFHRGGTTKTVKTSKAETKANRMLNFVVKDYGKGIDKRDFNKIFQPFLQAGDDTERIYGGTGLGLAITSKLVKGLGGSISVDSKLGEWSKFSLEFPFEGLPADIATISKSLENAKVVLVSNDETERHFLDSVGRYEVDSLDFDSCEGLESLLEMKGAIDRDRCYICLVQEDLYREESYRHFSDSSRSILLTFGPKYNIKEARGHYRSLVQVLPSVLMQSMASYLESSISGSQTTESITTSSSALIEKISYDTIRVLIAEDNVINQKVLQRMLQRFGLKNIDIVENGQKAVERTDQNHYDIVFMDMQMPVMDGLEACRLIVERRKEKKTPKVIFVTANVSDSYESSAAAAGGDGFISKPFNLQKMQKFFQTHRA